MGELAVIERAPDPTLIEHLEHLLAQAKSGELQGMVYITSWSKNYVSSGWSGLGDNRMRIMGELYQVIHHLAAMESR